MTYLHEEHSAKKSKRGINEGTALRVSLIQKPILGLVVDIHQACISSTQGGGVNEQQKHRAIIEQWSVAILTS
jgi:hypothetical protein